MRSILAGLRTLVLPWGAPSTQPRIVLGPDVPAALVSASANFTWTAAIVKYVSASDYTFEAVGTYVGAGGPFEVFATGTYDTTHGVMFNSFEQNMSVAGALSILYGSNVYNASQLIWAYRNGLVNIGDGTQAAGSGNVKLYINQDGSLLVQPGAVFEAPRLDYTPDGTTTETWHAATYQHSWTSTGSPPGLQYRRVASPPNSVQLIGIMTAGTKVDGTVITNLPAGYRPATTVPVPVEIAPPTLAGATTPQLQLLTTGDLVCFGCGSATTVYLNETVPLDAT